MQDLRAFPVRRIEVYFEREEVAGVAAPDRAARKIHQVSAHPSALGSDAASSRVCRLARPMGYADRLKPPIPCVLD